MLNHIPFAIPVKRLRETDSLLAFFHPQPAYPFHVILIPKKAIRSFSDLKPADPFLADLVITAAQSLVDEYHLHSLPADRQWRESTRNSLTCIFISFPVSTKVQNSTPNA